MTVYLTCDHELPEIMWIKDVSKLSVKRLNADDPIYERLRQISNRKSLYYVGAYEGCGCGFSFGNDISITTLLGDIWSRFTVKMQNRMMDKDQRCEKNGRDSVEALFAYIRSNLATGESIDLYSCWAGHEFRDFLINEEIDLSQYKLDTSFCFAENQHIRFYSESPSTP